jgi:hypothetical protein
MDVGKYVKCICLRFLFPWKNAIIYLLHMLQLKEMLIAMSQNI